MLQAPVAERMGEADEELVKAAGTILDGHPFIWVGPGILVPIREVLPDERKSIIADYRAVFAARMPGAGS
ncbi:MAG TPA: hypothetical protein VG734_25565 [Lacunisphaera sp.]|nr:hypothetical protein [Lacunisphaera sp.]